MHRLQIGRPSDQLAGMPDTADTMLGALAASGVLTAQAGGDWLWPIRPAGPRGQLQAVRLAAPEVLLSGADIAVQPLANRLTTVIPVQPAASPTEAPTDPVQALALAPPPADAMPASAGADQPPDPVQAVLFTDPDVSVETALAAQTSPAATPVPAATPLRLQAPMRLSPSVREALAAIVATLNATGDATEAMVTAQGVFVPVTALQAHGLLPPMAARALADAGMLASAASGSSPLHTRDIDGAPVQGLLIDVRWIDGLAIDTPGTSTAAGLTPC